MFSSQNSHVLRTNFSVFLSPVVKKNPHRSGEGLFGTETFSLFVNAQLVSPAREDLVGIARE